MATKPKDSLLRHIVIFKFKVGTTEDEIHTIEKKFSALPAKIREIADYEYGINNSPEGLDKGFTHCFFLTFESEADRTTYLPHPDHQAFVNFIGPYVDDVMVFDYWTKNLN